VWTLKSTYTWEANFPAGKTVEVEHSYTRASAAPLPPPSRAAVSTPRQDRPKIYKDKYCTDDTLIKTVKKSLKDPPTSTAPLLRELDLLHLSTGANWSGAIHKFHSPSTRATPRT